MDDRSRVYKDFDLHCFFQSLTLVLAVLTARAMHGLHGLARRKPCHAARLRQGVRFFEKTWLPRTPLGLGRRVAGSAKTNDEKRRRDAGEAL